MNTYKFIYELDLDYESIDDYPIEEYYKDERYYELIDEGDYEEIKCRTVKRKNETSDNILSNVDNHYKRLYGKYKYNVINIEDGNGDTLGCINLRIADHTENIQNVDRFGRCDYHISVVINNHDVTRDRFGQSNDFERRNNEYELKFDDSYSVEDIIEEIDSLISEIKEFFRE